MVIEIDFVIKPMAEYAAGIDYDCEHRSAEQEHGSRKTRQDKRVHMNAVPALLELAVTSLNPVTLVVSAGVRSF